MNFCGDGGRFRRQTQVVQGLADKQDVPCGVQAIFRTGQGQTFAQLAGAVEEVLSLVGGQFDRALAKAQTGDKLLIPAGVSAPQQHSRRLTRRLRDQVETVVHPIDEIEIHRARGGEQGLRPLGAAVLIGMARLVAAADVGFGLSDAADQQLAVQTAHQILAHQFPRHRAGVSVIKITE